MNIHIYIRPDGEVVITDLIGDLLPLAESLVNPPELVQNSESEALSHRDFVFRTPDPGFQSSTDKE